MMQAEVEAAAPAEPAGEVLPRPLGVRLHRAFYASLPLAVLGLIALIDFPICPSRLMWGVPCPGCGLTRASVAGLSLDFPAMLALHPFAPILTPVIAFFFVKAPLMELGVPRAWFARLPRIPQAVWGVLLVALLGFWGVRLAGWFGGLPDPVDPTQGWVWQTGAELWTAATR